MKSVRSKKNQNVSRRNATASTSMLATNLPNILLFPNQKSATLANATVARPASVDPAPEVDMIEGGASLPFPDAHEEEPGAVPAYETTAPCDEKGAKKRQTVAHMDELKAQQAVFLDTMLSLHYSSQLHTPCSCSVDRHVRTVACTECLQAELLCPQCWLHKHRTMPTHWALIWDAKGKFFQKHDFCRVMKKPSIALGHYGERWSRGGPGSDIHVGGHEWHSCHRHQVSAGQDCRRMSAALRLSSKSCARVYSRGASKIRKQAIHWGLLEYYREERNQGKGSAVQLRTSSAPDGRPLLCGRGSGYIRQLSRHHPGSINISASSCSGGHAHRDDVPRLAKPTARYPNRAIGYLASSTSEVSSHVTIDGNYKNNMFFKRDDGSDTALTDGNMHFPPSKEYEQIAKEYVIAKEDKEVPCRRILDRFRHQGHAKYGNVAISGVALTHSVRVSDTRTHRRVAQSPPTPLVVSYDSYCSFVVNQLKRATVLFPKDSWFHEMLEGGVFACRGTLPRETAEMIWGFLNPLGGVDAPNDWRCPPRHHQFVIDAWNTRKVLRQAELLAGERADALRLFELHMAVLEDLSRQHSTEVGGWSRLSRKVSKSDDGQLASVYQHQSTKVLTIENVLASLLAEEQEQRQRLPRAAGSEPTTSLAQWVRDGMDIERQQVLVIAFLQNHRQHPLQETWNTITRVRDSLNITLKNFRERQRTIYPRLTLSALDRTTTDATDSDSQLRQAEIKLRCSEADSGILAVRAASLALSAIRKARELDYRGQVGITRSQHNIQNAELMKFFEMDMYNKARAALTHLERKRTYIGCRGTRGYLMGPPGICKVGGTVHSGGFASSLSPVKRRDEDEGQPQFMTGTQTLKRAGGVVKSPRAPKRLKDIIPDDVAVDCPVSSGAEDSDLDMSPSEPGKLGRARGERKKRRRRGGRKRGEMAGYGWKLCRGEVTGEGKLAEYKRESDRVQWFRAEAEMYRWLEAYERKHAELFRVIARFRRDSEVWTGRADRDEMENGGALLAQGAFCSDAGGMYQRLQHNAEVHFRSPESGAHHDWVTATSFDELVAKVTAGVTGSSRGWMEWYVGIYRAYKDF
ncbi:hypothetical protein B0H14DRAFT_3457899 [Mycena olivaceomarginata]|nr:hypothetical protein B0H14DRAFT_3457899 [Mycena olivaceomarginata]